MRVMKHGKPAFSVLVVALAAILAVLQPSASLAGSLMVNPSFETGDTTGWTASPAPKGTGTTATAGFVKVVQNGYADIGVEFLAKDDSYFALLKSGKVGIYTTLSQTLTAAPGDIVAGWAFFKTKDIAPYNDDSYVHVKQGDTIVANLFTRNRSDVGNYGSTPWTWYQYTFTTAGTYTFEAGVRNVLDSMQDSYLGLDAVFLDGTPPVVVPTVTPGPNAGGWNNTNATVTWNVYDPESGIQSSTGAGAVTLTTDTSGTTLTCTATNKVGMTTTNSVTVKLDKTPPTISGSRSPGANGNGWNNANVTVEFTAGDTLSGLASVTPNTVVSAEGQNQSVTGTATDNAGNTATATVGSISIDKTKPTMTFGSVTPAPTGAGWNKTDATISYTPADALSGVDTPAAGALSFNTEGDSQTQSVTVTDRAGNTETFTSPVVRIDKTPPTISGSRSPAANANGWNNADVTAEFSAADTLSGLASVTPNTLVSTEGQNQSVTGTATDNAGNTATATVGSISIDKTKPTMTFGAVTPAPNGAGWNSDNVTISFIPADAMSGVDTPAAGTLSFNAEGDNQTQSVTVTDKAGNSQTFTSPVVRIDRTLPTLTFGAVGRAPNEAGWYNTDVSVPFTAGDGGSGLTGPPSGSVLLTAEGTAVTGTVTVTDGAGNTATFTTDPFKIDKTLPTISGSRSPGPNGNGWNNGDVTVLFTGADSLSGIASLTPTSVVLTADGASQSVMGVAKDYAGNTATFTVNGINIDKTKPTLIFGAIAPPPTAGGWNRTDVSISYTPADALSGVDTPAAGTLSFNAEGNNQTQSVTVTDKAGNSDTFTSPVVRIDRTPPTLVFGTASPAANAAGWNNTDVSIPFTASDNLSGVSGTSPSATPLVLNTEGTAVAGTVTVTDAAGNTATFTTPSFKIDKTLPTVSGTRIPAGNANGWNNGDVTVRFTFSDTLSGIASGPSDTVITAEGGSQSVTGVATDNAGNSASVTVNAINIDRTPPTISGSRTPGPNGNGWNNTDVTVKFTAADNLSGIASVTPDTTLTAEGAGQSVNGTAKDKADNSKSSSVGGINIDKTAPVIVITSPEAKEYPDSGSITLGFSASDNGSGMNTLAATLDGRSVANGQVISLSGMSGSHTLAVTAADKAGNTASQSVTFTVKGTAPPPADARGLKAGTIAKLRSAKAGDKSIDNTINKVIWHIERSLDADLWVDATHLVFRPKNDWLGELVDRFTKKGKTIDDDEIDDDRAAERCVSGSKNGITVFHQEKSAVGLMETHGKNYEKEIPKLEKLIAQKESKKQDARKEKAELAALKKVVPVFKEVIADLVAADKILASVALADAKSTPVSDPKRQKIVTYQISRAEKAFALAVQAANKNNPDTAVYRFGHSWQHSQLAMKFATIGKR